MSSAKDRFLRYVQVHTTSAENVTEVPSTSCQFDLAHILKDELVHLGLSDATVDSHCYVTGTLQSNLTDETAKNVPVIGLIAHLDTVPSIPGKNVHPQVIHYTGGPIHLPSGVVIPEDEALKCCLGHELITSDGTTLLGADDKAGIAAIMSALEDIISLNLPHGTVRICFTPDEEVGNGASYFNVKKFGAYCAYTVDGHLPGEINRETFTAECARVVIRGKEVHPGIAKDVMINAVRVAANFISLLPENFSPEKTQGHEPFLHPYIQDTSSVSEASLSILMRAFTDKDMDMMRNMLENAAEQTQEKYPESTLEITYKPQYRNMLNSLQRYPDVTGKLEEAVRRAGAVPLWTPIRGGTDGSRLTEMGLPTPNIFTGGHNVHSFTEWLSVEMLEQTVRTLQELILLWAVPAE